MHRLDLRLVCARAIKGATCIAAMALLTGCTSPNTYATARTLSPGDITHTVAVEGIAYHGSQGTGVLPVLPTYVFRVGVIDHLDIGARIGSLTELGADIKVNFLRGPIDLAIAGGAEAFLEWHYEPHGDRPPPHRTGSRAWFHLPLIVAYNMSRQLSLVASPGVAYVDGKKVGDDFVRTQPFDGGTLAGRLGFGIDYRYREHRAVHPEVTLIQSFQASATIVMFGVGFNFGDLPKYDDIAGAPPEGTKAPAPPPPAPAPTTTTPEPTPTPVPTTPPPPPAPPPPAPTAPPPAPPPQPTDPSEAPGNRPIF